MHFYMSSSLILLVSIVFVLLDQMNGWVELFPVISAVLFVAIFYFLIFDLFLRIDSRDEKQSQPEPSEKSPSEVPTTNTPEEGDDRNEERDDADTYENSVSSDEDLQEIIDKIIEKLLSKKLKKMTEKLLAASSSSESSPRKPQKTYSQALMTKFAPEPDEDHQRSEASEDVKNTLPLDDRLKGVMDDAIKELVAENILEVSSPNDSEEDSHHSLDEPTSVALSSPSQKLVDEPNEECSSPKKDTNVSASTSHQIDSPDVKVQPGKKSSEKGDKEASGRPPATENDKSSSKTGKEKASVLKTEENERASVPKTEEEEASDSKIRDEKASVLKTEEEEASAADGGDKEALERPPAAKDDKSSLKMGEEEKASVSKTEEKEVPVLKTQEEEASAADEKDKQASERPPAAKDDKNGVKTGEEKASASKTEEEEKASVSKTEEKKASVEGESSTSSSSTSTKKMSYALALMGSSWKVDDNTENEDIKGKKPAVDDETTQKSPLPVEAREKQTENKTEEPEASEDNPIELFCPPEPQREAIQTNATSINLKYNANRRQVLISPRRSNVNIFYEFRRLNIDLRKFGVHTSVYLPSGSVFLKFENEAGPRKLHEAIFSTGLFQMATTRSSPCQVRIHGVPFETNMAELYYDLHMKYDAIPQRVRFTRDERDPRGIRGSLAIIEVSESLLHKMAEAPDIRIRWCSRKIETTVRIFRCSNCYVLAHRSAFCRLPKRSAPTIYEPCVDCSYHNRCSELVGRPKDRARDTNHRTDDNERCVTKQQQVSRSRENHNGREVELRPLLM